MALLYKIFQNRKNSKNTNRPWTSSEQTKAWTAPAFNKSQIRLIVFRDHDLKGRHLLFDSKAVQKIEDPDQKITGYKHKLGSKPPPRPGGGGSPRTGPKFTMSRPGSDTKMLGEMMFGSIAMSYKGSTLKVHTIRSPPPQLMVSKVFIPPKPHRESGEAEDPYGLQSSSISGGESTYPCTKARSLQDADNSSSIAHSVPVDISLPPHRDYCDRDVDSGLSGSVVSSNSSFTTPFPSPGTGSSSSINSNSYNSLHRRWIRNKTTSLDWNFKKRSSDDSAASSEPAPLTKRTPKVGIAILINLPSDGEEDSTRQYQNFFFSHITLVEGQVNKLCAAVEKALTMKKNFVHLVVEALETFRNSMHDLYTAPRLTDPVWLNMMCYSTHRVQLCQEFLKELMLVVEKYDTKSTNFLISTLITAVLTHHLAWVPTVSPAGATPSRTYLDKHSAKWLDALAKSHPYNPLWAQLGDLYGSIGYPLRLCRTIVVGKKADLICKILYILSYFIRCSEVLENSEDRDDMEDCDTTLTSLTVENQSWDTFPIQEDGCESCRRNRVYESSMETSGEGSHTWTENSPTPRQITMYLSDKMAMSGGSRHTDSGSMGTPNNDYSNFDLDENDNKENMQSSSSTIMTDSVGSPRGSLSSGTNVGKGAGPPLGGCFVVFPEEKQTKGDVLGTESMQENTCVQREILQTANFEPLGDQECLVAGEKASSEGKTDKFMCKYDTALYNTQEDKSLCVGDRDTGEPVERKCQLSPATVKSDIKIVRVTLNGRMPLTDMTSKQQQIQEDSKLTAKTIIQPQESSTQMHHGSDLSNLDCKLPAELSLGGSASRTQTDVLTNPGACDESASRKSSMNTDSDLSHDSGVFDGQSTDSQFDGAKHTCKCKENLVQRQKSEIDSSFFDEYFEEDSKHPLKRLPSNDGSLIGMMEEYMNEPCPEVAVSAHDKVLMCNKQQVMNRMMSQEGSLSMFDEYYSDDGHLEGKDGTVSHQVLKSHGFVRQQSYTEFGSDTHLGCETMAKIHEHGGQPKAVNWDEASLSHQGAAADSAERPDSLTLCVPGKKMPFSRQSSVQSTGTPGRTRSVTPTELGRRRHLSSASTNTVEEGTDQFLALKEVPVPRSCHRDSSPSVQSFDHNFGRSLLAGYSDHYMSNFVLHGTSDVDFRSKMQSDLSMALQNSVLDEQIAESVCVVADTDKWRVQLVSCQYHTLEQYETVDVVASHLVSNTLESVHNLWKLKMSPEFCLMHLEDRLQEIYFKSKMLADYTRTNKKIDMKHISTILGLDLSDIPLLKAVAGTHSPQLAYALG